MKNKSVWCFRLQSVMTAKYNTYLNEEGKCQSFEQHLAC